MNAASKLTTVCSVFGLVLSLGAADPPTPAAPTVPAPAGATPGAPAPGTAAPGAPSATGAAPGAGTNAAPSLMVIAPAILIGSQGNLVRVAGLNLTNASEVRFVGSNAPGAFTIKSRGLLPAGTDTNKFGDTQLELELAMTPQAPAGTSSFIVVGPGGQSQPKPIMVFPPDAIYPEKEPNGAFVEAQDLPFGKVIEGTIYLPKDLDVFRVTGRAGQSIQAQVVASVLGSPVDSLMNFYDAQAHLLATNDNAGGLDSMIQLVLPADGSYYITLVDAKEGGGPAYAYYLLLTVP